MAGSVSSMSNKHHLAWSSARISHEHCVNLSPRQEEQDILQKQERYQISTVFTKGALKEMPLGYSPGSAIFFSVLAMNIVYYSPLPKTSNLTLRGLMRNPG
jgi:hypothetical protein